MPGRKEDPDDKNIWQVYAAKVKRTAPKAAKVSQPASQKWIERPAAMPLAALPNSAMTPLQNAHDFKTHQFDRRTERQMRDGTFIVDAMLDMHGMTQKEAYEALQIFMAAQIKRAKRNLLIITGKGRRGDGVLRTHLPRWLESLPCASLILNLRPAAIKHGGSGAFYVVLRRPAKKPQ